MSAINKAALLAVIGSCVFLLAQIAYASQDSANQMCKPETGNCEYGAFCDYPKNTIKGVVGKYCEDKENGKVAAWGHCIMWKKCLATVCDGGPCKTASPRVDQSQNQSPTPPFLQTPPSLTDGFPTSPIEANSPVNLNPNSAFDGTEPAQPEGARPEERGWLQQIRDYLGGGGSPSEGESNTAQGSEMTGQSIYLDPNSMSQLVPLGEESPAVASEAADAEPNFNTESTFGPADNLVNTPEEARPQMLSRDVLSEGEGRPISVTNRYGTFNTRQFTPEQLAQIQGNTFPANTSVYNEVEATAYGGMNNPNDFTYASKELPQDARTLFWNPTTGNAAVSAANDTGPFYPNRDFDITPATQNAIGARGLDTVTASYVGQNGPTGYIGKFDSAAEAVASYQQANGGSVGSGPLVSSNSLYPWGTGSVVITSYGPDFGVAPRGLPVAIWSPI